MGTFGVDWLQLSSYSSCTGFCKERMSMNAKSLRVIYTLTAVVLVAGTVAAFASPVIIPPPPPGVPHLV